MADNRPVVIEPTPAAEPTLEDLVREFNNATQQAPSGEMLAALIKASDGPPQPEAPAPEPPPPAPVPDPIEEAQKARHRRDAAVADQLHAANVLKQATAEFKAGGIDDDDALVTGYLLKRALDNPKFAEASAARETNPTVWNKELAAARSDYLKLSRSSSSYRGDLEAAHAAVRNSSAEERPQPTLDPVAVMRMSDQEWAKVLEDASRGTHDPRHANVWSGGRGSTPRRR